MSLTPRMADSTEPARIPNLYRTKPNGVLVYRTGPYAWPESEIQRFDGHRIGIVTEYFPGCAKLGRECDIERFDMTIEQGVQFVDDRLELHPDATVYCDRSTVPEFWHATGDRRDFWWHIATLDGYRWTPAELATWILREYQIAIDWRKIAAIQWLPDQGGGYDVSSWFTDPHWQ